MSDKEQPATPATAPKEDPETLVLRGSPRPAVRFRRGLIITITGSLAAGLVAISWLALDPPSFRAAPGAADSEEPARSGGPDALADVPRSYSDVPRLGPPLPGDLGGPILEHRRNMGEPNAPAALDGEAERQRLAAAEQAARSSAVLVQLGRSPGPAADPAEVAGSSAAGIDAPAPADAIPASQKRKIDFARSGEGDINPHVVRSRPARWVLSAGTVIPASLVTGLNSDLPGFVFAQVTENVRDSATGRAILIPQGARLIGRYDSAVDHGQRRVLLVWSRIVFPDGSSLQLDHLPAADSSGHAGLADEVDFHGWRLLKGIGLSTVLGVGTELSLGSGESELVRALRESAQQNAAQAGDQFTRRNLDIQPTIMVRPGWPVRAIVHKDLVLQPWRG